MILLDKKDAEEVLGDMNLRILRQLKSKKTVDSNLLIYITRQCLSHAITSYQKKKQARLARLVPLSEDEYAHEYPSYE